MLLVIKRNTSKEAYSLDKIKNAVKKAFCGCKRDFTPAIEKKLEKYFEGFPEDTEGDSEVSVDVVHSKIEQFLMRYNYFDVSTAYILRRYQKALDRAEDQKFAKGIAEKLMALRVENQNANVDEASFGGRIGEASRYVTKQFALDYCVSKMARENHLGNEIYIHDLDSYATGMHNCLSIPFDDLLANGFKTRQVDIRAARSFNTACQLVAVIFQLQSLNQFGGVSATHLDFSLAPYLTMSFQKHYLYEYLKTTEEFMKLNLLEITEEEFDDWMTQNKEEYFKEMGLTVEDVTLSNRDKLNSYFYQAALFETRKECYQAVEALYHNLNSLQSRSGNQLPFTSINYGCCTSPEGRLIIRALLETSIKGTGPLGKTPIFPCGIFQCKKGTNQKPGDPNYDLFKLALKSTSLRLYPNYANVDWSGNAGYDENDPRTYFSTMGCRTANGYDINHDPDVNPQMKDGRGNICPVTIILPTLAMKAGKDTEKFMRLLGKKIEEAKDMLIERFNWICAQPPKSARFMYENNTMYGYKPEEGIRSALKHGTLAIGQLGLAECLRILIGTDHTTEEGMKLAKRIESLFKKRCLKYKEEYSLNFGVYYTPAENLCYTAMKKFREKYGIIEGISDRLYFTNSMHVSVWKDVDPFQKIDIESQLTGYSSAGCITYVELKAGCKHNIDSLETLVLYAMNHDIPYFAVNIPNDTCNDCGYTEEIAGEECPKCGGHNITRLRRVTGLTQ